MLMYADKPSSIAVSAVERPAGMGGGGIGAAGEGATGDGAGPGLLGLEDPVHAAIATVAARRTV